MTVEMLTVADVARITSLSEYTVRAAVRERDLPASKVRGRIIVRPDDLAAWIDGGRIGAPTTPVIAPRPQRRPPAGGARAAIRERRSAAA